MYKIYENIIQYLTEHQELHKDDKIICNNRLFNNDPERIKNTCNCLDAILNARIQLNSKYPEEYISKLFIKHKALKISKLIDQICKIINQNKLPLSPTATNLYGWIVTWTILNPHKFLADNKYTTLYDFYLQEIIPQFFPELDQTAGKLMTNILLRISNRLEICIKLMNLNAPDILITSEYWNLFNDLHQLLNPSSTL